jgi:hypothetical protein
MKTRVYYDTGLDDGRRQLFFIDAAELPEIPDIGDEVDLPNGTHKVVAKRSSPTAYTSGLRTRPRDGWDRLYRLVALTHPELSTIWNEMVKSASNIGSSGLPVRGIVAPANLKEPFDNVVYLKLETISEAADEFEGVILRGWKGFARMRRGHGRAAALPFDSGFAITLPHWPGKRSRKKI